MYNGFKIDVTNLHPGIKNTNFVFLSIYTNVCEHCVLSTYLSSEKKTRTNLTYKTHKHKTRDRPDGSHTSILIHICKLSLRVHINYHDNSVSGEWCKTEIVTWRVLSLNNVNWYTI